MLRRYLASLILGWCSLAVILPAEPLNLTTAKEAVIQYVDSGEYELDVAEVAARAREWIATRVADKQPGEKLAVIFDIDETALSNVHHMREMDFGYVPALWDAWVADQTAPPIGPVRDIYRLARRHELGIFFITGRREKDRPGTVRNLQQVGYGEYNGLTLKPDDYEGSTVAFKAAERERIESEGWTLIANFGDQQSDLDGGAAEKTFKLPNPFYLIQ